MPVLVAFKKPGKAKAARPPTKRRRFDGRKPPYQAKGRFPRRTPIRYGAYTPLKPIAAARAVALQGSKGGLRGMLIALGLLAALLLLDQFLKPEEEAPLPELQLPDWSGLNDPRIGQLDLDWWPTGFTTDLPNYPSRIDIGYLRVGLALDENDEVYVESSEFVEHSTRDDLVVGTIVKRTELLDPNYAYITRQTWTNVAPDGSREDILQLISSFYLRLGPAKFDISPLAGPSPGRPYPPAPSVPSLPEITPAPTAPRPRPIPNPVPAAPPRIQPRPADPRDLPAPIPQPLPSTVPTTAPVAPRRLDFPLPAASPRVMTLPQEMTETLLDGAIAPASTPPVIPVPPGLEIPWPGADPIGQPSKRPPPTLEGIAKELGKIEQKVAQIGERGPGTGGPGFELQDLIDAIKEEIPEPEMYIYPAGSYVLEPVCDYDAEGNLLDPISAEWPAGTGRIPEVLGRLGAIAELLQIHKELRQPICRGNPPQGQPVTVTFEEEPA